MTQGISKRLCDFRGLCERSLFLLPLFIVNEATAKDQGRPNILCITCEDISPRLGCYGDRVAKTPNLELYAQFYPAGIDARRDSALSGGVAGGC